MKADNLSLTLEAPAFMHIAGDESGVATSGIASGSDDDLDQEEEDEEEFATFDTNRAVKQRFPPGCTVVVLLRSNTLQGNIMKNYDKSVGIVQVMYGKVLEVGIGKDRNGQYNKLYKISTASQSDIMYENNSNTHQNDKMYEYFKEQDLQFALGTPVWITNNYGIMEKATILGSEQIMPTTMEEKISSDQPSNSIHYSVQCCTTNRIHHGLLPQNVFYRSSDTPPPLPGRKRKSKKNIQKETVEVNESGVKHVVNMNLQDQQNLYVGLKENQSQPEYENICHDANRSHSSAQDKVPKIRRVSVLSENQPPSSCTTAASASPTNESPRDTSLGRNLVVGSPSGSGSENKFDLAKKSGTEANNHNLQQAASNENSQDTPCDNPSSMGPMLFNPPTPMPIGISTTESAPHSKKPLFMQRAETQSQPQDKEDVTLTSNKPFPAVEASPKQERLGMSSCSQESSETGTKSCWDIEEDEMGTEDGGSPVLVQKSNVASKQIAANADGNEEATVKNENPNRLQKIQFRSNYNLYHVLGAVRSHRLKQGLETSRKHSGVGKFLFNRCLNWHLRGVCKPHCPRKKDHKQLSPNMTRLLEDQLQPAIKQGLFAVSMPCKAKQCGQGPSAGRKRKTANNQVNSSTALDSNKRRRVQPFVEPTNSTVQDDASIVEHTFNVPACYGLDFVKLGIMGLDGSKGQILADKYSCSIKIEEVGHGKHFAVQMKGPSKTSIFECCFAIESALCDAAPLGLRPHLLVMLGSINNHRQCSKAIVKTRDHLSVNSTQYLAMVHTGHTSNRKKREVALLDAKQWKNALHKYYPTCTVDVLERSNWKEFHHVFSYIIIFGPNFDDVHNCRDTLQSWAWDKKHNLHRPLKKPKFS